MVYAVDIGKEFKFGERGIERVFPTLGQLVSVVLPNIYILAGIILLILLLFGGLNLIMAAGGGDSQKTEQGKKAVTAAIVGFLIIFASYWIIQIVQTITGIKILGSTL